MGELGLGLLDGRFRRVFDLYINVVRGMTTAMGSRNYLEEERRARHRLFWIWEIRDTSQNETFNLDERVKHACGGAYLVKGLQFGRDGKSSNAFHTVSMGASMVDSAAILKV